MWRPQRILKGYRLRDITVTYGFIRWWCRNNCVMVQKWLCDGDLVWSFLRILKGYRSRDIIRMHVVIKRKSRIFKLECLSWSRGKHGDTYSLIWYISKLTTSLLTKRKSKTFWSKRKPRMFWKKTTNIQTNKDLQKNMPNLWEHLSKGTSKGDVCNSYVCNRQIKNVFWSVTQM